MKQYPTAVFLSDDDATKRPGKSVVDSRLSPQATAAASFPRCCIAESIFATTWGASIGDLEKTAAIPPKSSVHLCLAYGDLSLRHCCLEFWLSGSPFLILRRVLWTRPPRFRHNDISYKCEVLPAFPTVWRHEASAITEEWHIVLRSSSKVPCILDRAELLSSRTQRMLHHFGFMTWCINVCKSTEWPRCESGD